MSIVFSVRKLRYHDDPNHTSNWCKICRLYYCWHDEAKEFDLYKQYQNDPRAKGHKFVPQEEGWEDD